MEEESGVSPPTPTLPAEKKETTTAAAAGETPAISLRSFELADVDDYMVWASDERVARFCRWSAYTSKEELLKYMRETVLPHPWFRAICLDGRPVGAVSVALNAPGSGDRCRGEIGYVLAAAHWGRGIAAEAVRAAAAAVFREVPELERLEALVDVENRASQRVLEKVGFLREGVLRKYFSLKGTTRDVVVYSHLSTDYPLLSAK
ncbi:unnamed protein product [Spirodela intermedia]|uniref:N-acetyltransferase domain-containing protein n=1 Tax=Spirodela intermedia TaxID=51605 RepID=A0A7I8I8G9_SPIIN|nr:unnamed protein product [Spirodela intermedia]CAA6653798.1 unnamed protein product [Spirodela intermedia]